MATACGAWFEKVFYFRTCVDNVPFVATVKNSTNCGYFFFGIYFDGDLYYL